MLLESLSKSQQAVDPQSAPISGGVLEALRDGASSGHDSMRLTRYARRRMICLKAESGFPARGQQMKKMRFAAGL